MTELITSFIGISKANLTWFHAAHHVSKGTGFAGDHVNLFGEIYLEMIEIFDELVEKSIVLADTEMVACPIVLAGLESSILDNYESPCNQHGDQIAVLGLTIIREHLDIINEVYQTLEANNFLTLGMDDFLASTAGKFEKFQYLLNQRVKRGY